VTSASGRSFSAAALTPGRGRGPALVLDEPLSFWGGVDPSTGRIVDAHHPQLGATIAGRVLVMPSGRGSSSSSSVLAEALRAGTGPLSILLRRRDGILVLGAVVARELYGIEHPIALLDEHTHATLRTDVTVEVVSAERAATVTVFAQA
jgi:uncharacterized protein